MSEMRQRAIEGLKKGDTFSYARTFSQAETEALGDLTRDYNPVHYDRRFAGAKGFPGLICHGLLVGSMVCQMGGQVGWLATGMEFRFLKPVYFGDTITCIIQITDLDERCLARAEAVLTNQEGLKVMDAVLTGYLPEVRDREILKAMVGEGDQTNKLA